MSSCCAYEPPTSAYSKAFGSGVDVSDLPICIGNEFRLLVGKDTPYRYKLIEHDEKLIREYVSISAGPVDSPLTNMFTLFTNKVDKSTLKVEKFYHWNIIQRARNYFGFGYASLLSKEIQDEVKCEGALLNYPGLDRSYQWSHDHLERYESEFNELDRLHMISANCHAIDDDFLMNGRFFLGHPLDVFRGVSKENEPVIFKSYLGHALTSGPINNCELKKMIGPDYATRPYQRCLMKCRDISNETSIEDLGEFTGWFDLLKYIELIPYGEFYVSFSKDKLDVMRVYDPYDRGRTLDLNPETDTTTNWDAFVSMRRLLNDLLPNAKTLSVYRSWGEEVYITYKTQDCKTKQFFFDLIYCAIGSRMFKPSNN